MLVLWLVLGVVLFAILVVAVTTTARRRGRRHAAEATTSAAAVPTSPLAEPEHEAEEPVEPHDPRSSVLVEEAPLPAEAAEEAQVEVEAPPSPPELRERLGKTRGLLSGYIRSLRSRGSVDEQTWEDLEEALLRADMGVSTTNALMQDLRARVKKGELRGPDTVLDALREDLRATLRATAAPNGLASSGPAVVPGATHDRSQGTDGRHSAGEHTAGEQIEVWLFVGVNGVGKTTTIGKVARAQSAAGRRVLLAAGDTFRAAAAEQLSMWGERVGAEVIRGAEGADPSSVVFDAVRSAASRGCDLVLADTAGRLHTRVNLIEELKKIKRVAARPPGSVTEVLLVLDATTGQNGLTQARQFLDAVGVTGVVLTKLDGTAKGGIVVAIQKELGLPVKLVGLGEGADDLVPFDPGEFVDALFE
jgi:fused signal recognition particle receptor